MFGFLAAPLIGGLISNLFNNNHHHHNHCGGGHGGNSAATNFALAQEDFKDAAQDFARTPKLWSSVLPDERSCVDRALVSAAHCPALRPDQSSGSPRRCFDCQI